MAMGKIYDIMSKLTNTKPTIKIDNEHEYTVNDSKNQALFIHELSQDPNYNDIERMDKIIEAGLGEEALKYINSLNLNLKATATIVNAIMAAINDMELEEVENVAREGMANKSPKGKRK
jgi:hypothetical protein